MLADTIGRPLGTLRISVTDRCNLRCAYCMPEDEYVWLPDASILTAHEVERVANVFAALGVREVRLTGGEPLLRPDLEEIVERLARIGLDLALTTNGLQLAARARALKEAGLGRVTVSLDTLSAERARTLSRTTRLHDVIAGLDALRDAGFSGTKINTVVMRGRNDDELEALVRLARDKGAEARFIEYMDVGGATRWSMHDVVPRHEIVERLGRAFGGVTASHVPRGSAPAQRYVLASGETFGVIASTTAPFCGDCDRARVTADGLLFTCLYAERGVDLRGALRADEADEPVLRLVRSTWEARRDRGAEERQRIAVREALVPVGRLRADPHREMHTRGG